MMLSLILYLERTYHPRIVTRAPDLRLPKRPFSSDREVPGCPQLKFLRIEGAIFFGVVNHVRQAFAQEARKRKARGGRMYLVRVKKGLWEPMERCGCLEAIGSSNLFQSEAAAVTGIYQHLYKSVCASCDKHIFRECGPAIAA